MAGYDPQKGRHRPRPTNGSSAAPVDTILDGPSDPEPEAPVVDLTPDTEPQPEPELLRAVPEPDARPVPLDLTPPSPAGPSPARLIAGAGLVALVLAILWWLRKRSSTTDEG
jgi:hypothetical protein